MKERPILFSGAMVRAILDGRKCQTRRVVKPSDKKWADGCASRIRHERHPFSPSAFVGTPAEGRAPGADRMAWVFYDWVDNPIGVNEADWLRCPYGTIGDRLWCRETWAVERACDNEKPSEIESHYPVVYLADAPCGQMHPAFQGKTRPSLFMPRWASRLTLEITGVRVERVQIISEADARAEGMQPNWAGELSGWNADEHGFLPYDADDEGNVPGCDPYDSFTARDCFARLWDSINAARPGCTWDDNPWVWVVEFRRVGEETA